MTNKPAHTPEPWSYWVENHGEIGSRDKVRVEAADGHIAIASRVMQNNGRNTFGKELNVHRALPEVKANAQRIVSCVNALTGIPDPKAHMEAVGELVKAAKSLENQIAINDFVDSHGHLATSLQALHLLRAALEKIEGAKP